MEPQHSESSTVFVRPFHAAAPSDPVESRLVRKASRRLEIACALIVLAVVSLWIGPNLLRGRLGDELGSPSQWAPPVAALIASLAVLVTARTGGFSPPFLVRIGLVYEVVVSYAIATATYLGAFQGLSAADLTEDRIGMSYVAPWMLFFTVFVPARPRDAALALVLSAAAVPVVYLLEVSRHLAPALPSGQFLVIFVLPYGATVAFAYIAARIVHSLGVEVRQAHELGSYRLESKLGQGGMGEVWRASHRWLARPAAVKLIRRDARDTDPGAAEIATARFEREAQVIAELQSPHTVQLFDFGTADDGTLYYVMELLDGIGLDTLVRRFGPLPAERVVHILRQVCASLAEAHRRGVMHRDVKPANIYICRYGIEHDFVKVLDFGLAKHLSAEDRWTRGLTETGIVAGTPQYMAPEAVLSPSVDGRADIYAVGCVAYWLLTGRHVFEAPTAAAAILAHSQHVPVPPSAVTELPIPESLNRIVLACLAKDPADRPQTAEALAGSLADVPLARVWGEADAAAWWTTHRPTSAAAQSQRVE